MMIVVKMKQRELLPPEKREIKKLVRSSCANFDSEYGCLRLDWPCYMCQKQYTGAFCLYFQEAVLPLYQELSASLHDRTLASKACKLCGKAFFSERHQHYCSETCRRKARLSTFRKSQKKHRAKQP